ncbi:GGDEF domain-containing protein [Sphingobium ummariense]|nr:GGDEF domain-containing protein [Sphingobium ummariense]
MAVAMGVAWAHFGRQRHMLSWTISYAIASVQWVSNAAGLVLKNPFLMGFAGLCIVVSASLVLVGVKQRSERPIPWRTLIGVGGLVSVASFYAALINDRPLQSMIVPGYAAILILNCAIALWPTERRFSAPEAGFFVILLLFATFEAGLVVSAATGMGSAPGQDMALYRAVLGLGLPSVYVATGVAAVLVVAGDLAYQLRRQIRHDPLTNVLNRLGFSEAAERAIANAQRQGRPLTFIICDLDGFKALNDGHGHLTGDAALRSFAGLLLNAVRRGDIVARMGGDEFGLLLIDTDATVAATVMERVRAEVACLILHEAPGALLRASFGVAQLRAQDRQIEDMVGRADQALYEAKRAGRNRIRVSGEAA